MDIFSALADPNRRRIVELLSEKPRSVNEIMEQFPLTQPGVSKHLRILREAGLVSFSAEGTHRVYRMRREALAQVMDWLGRHYVMWEDRLEALDNHLSTKRKKKTTARNRIS